MAKIAYADMSIEELTRQLADLKAELFNLRFQLATGQLQNPMQIKECKKNIARVHTQLRLREITAQKAL